uniref:Uncharacterized protein n=1 Tax=Anguilla anguilla TaxID=7936 RepID=A0A0E9R6V2_ANGAN
MVPERTMAPLVERIINQLLACGAKCGLEARGTKSFC